MALGTSDGGELTEGAMVGPLLGWMLVLGLKLGSLLVDGELLGLMLGITLTEGCKLGLMLCTVEGEKLLLLGLALGMLLGVWLGRRLGVWLGDDDGAPELFSNNSSELTFSTTNGVNYFLVVGGWSGSEDGTWKRPLPGERLKTSYGIPLQEEWMDEGTPVRSLDDPFEVPHVQLPLKTTILRLAEEQRQKFYQLVWLVHHDRSSILDPSDDRF